MRRTMLVVFFMIAASLISASLALQKFAVDRDFNLYATLECDPTFHSCFVGDGEEKLPLYKYATVSAYLVPGCDGWTDSCMPLLCTEERGCESGYCTGEEDVPCHGPLRSSNTP